MTGAARWAVAVVVVVVLAAVAVRAVGSGEPSVLTNGCAVSPRGLPECGAYVGAAVGGNDDPGDLETVVGLLGLRRTYWRADQTEKAVATARADLAARRVPWISFKLQVSWEDAARGARDAWALDLAERLGRLDGPVWVALHHEPEGDGDILAWRAVQERLGPVLRENADNVGFTVILTGWNQFEGPSEYALPRVWPETTVDVAGFDVYQFYGLERDGGVVLQATDLESRYLEPIAAWALDEGVRWGIAETGVTDRAARDRPDDLGRTYDALVAHGGVAFSYFDSPLNSTGSWTLGTPEKQEQFAEILGRSPRLPDLR